MRRAETRRRGLLGFAALAFSIAGCGGGGDFANDPRPPVPLEVSGVVSADRVTVQPSRFGAGPITLIVSNQTEAGQSLTLTGAGDPDRVGPINPRGTATLQKTLAPGRYRVSAAKGIHPAILEVGAPRSSASDQLLLP